MTESIDNMIFELITEIDYELDDTSFDNIVSFIEEIKDILREKIEYDKEWNNWERTLFNEIVYHDDNYNNQYYRDYHNYGYHSYYGDYYKAKPQQTKTVQQNKKNKVVKYRPNKQLTEWKIFIKSEISDFIQKMMVENKEDEWGITFTWYADRENKLVVIDKLYVMPIQVGISHVEFVNESEYVIFQDISELPEYVKDIKTNNNRHAGIMHSHHTMGSWHSSIDYGTINRYITDFNSVLSIVWGWDTKSDYITADILLYVKNDKYLIEDFILENNYDMDKKVINKLTNSLIDKYNHMIKIVKENIGKYNKILELFKKTNKYQKISELYEIYNNGNNNCENIKLLKEIIE